MINIIKRKDIPENKVEMNVVDNGLNIEDARKARAIRVSEVNNINPDTSVPDDAKNTPETPSVPEKSDEMASEQIENNPKTNENGKNDLEISAEEAEAVAETNGNLSEQNEKKPEEAEQQNETANFPKIRQQWQDKISQNNTPKNIFSRAINFVRKSDGVKVVAGLGVAGLALTTAPAIGGVGLVAIPLAYGLGVKFGLEGVVGFVQNKFLGGKSRENNIKNIEDNIEQKLRIYESYENSDVESRDAMLKDMKNEITRLNKEHQVQTKEYSQWYANHALIRSTIGTVGSIGVGIGFGVPLGFQQFEGSGHTVFWTAKKGLSFLYNSKDVIGNATTFSSWLGGPAHTITAGVPLWANALLYTGLIGTTGGMIADTSVRAYNCIKNYLKSQNIKQDKTPHEIAKDVNKGIDKNIPPTDSQKKVEVKADKAVVENNKATPPANRKKDKNINVTPTPPTNPQHQIRVLSPKSVPANQPKKTTPTPPLTQEEKFRLRTNISPSQKKLMEDSLKNWQTTNEVNVNEFVRDIVTFRYMGRQDYRQEFVENQKNKLITNAQFDKLLDAGVRKKYISEIGLAFVYLGVKEEFAEWEIKFDNEFKKYKADNNIEKSLARTGEFKCDYEEINNFVANLSRSKAKNYSPERLAELIKNNQRILRERIEVRRDYIDQNDVALYFAEIVDAYSHLGIELSLAQEKKYQEMLSKVGKKIGK